VECRSASQHKVVDSSYADVWNRAGQCGNPVRPGVEFAAEFLRAYPGANILIASKDDLQGDKRRQLLSRIATGDWDGVLITHASFERIKMSDEFMEEHCCQGERNEASRRLGWSRSTLDKRLALLSAQTCLRFDEDVVQLPPIVSQVQRRFAHVSS